MKKIYIISFSLLIVILAAISGGLYMKDDSNAKEISSYSHKISNSDDFSQQTKFYNKAVKINSDKMLFFDKSSKRKSSIESQYHSVVNNYYSQMIINQILPSSALVMSSKDNVDSVKSALSNLNNLKKIINSNKSLNSVDKKSFNKMIDQLVKSYENLLSTNNNVDKDKK